MKKFTLVEVYWVDSRQTSPSWEFIKSMKLPKICKCRSVGYLIKKTKCKIVIAQNVGDLASENPQGSGFFTIPTKCVIWLRTV